MSATFDNLTRYYGTEKVTPNVIGEYRNDGPYNVIEIHAAYTDFPAVASNSVVIGRGATILPIGAVVERVEIFCPVDMDSAGDAMTLNVGWINLDETNGVDVDAFVVAATQTELNTGGTNIAGWVGAEVNGAPLTVPKFITWEVDAAAATGGDMFIRLFYSVP